MCSFLSEKWEFLTKTPKIFQVLTASALCVIVLNACSRSAKTNDDGSTSDWEETFAPIAAMYPFISKDEANGLLKKHATELEEIVSLMKASPNLESMVRDETQRLILDENLPFEHGDIEYRLGCANESYDGIFAFVIKDEKREVSIFSGEGFGKIVDSKKGISLVSYLSDCGVRIEDFRELCKILRKHSWLRIAQDDSREFVNVLIGLGTGLQHKITPTVKGENTVRPGEGHLSGNWYYFIQRS